MGRTEEGEVMLHPYDGHREALVRECPLCDVHSTEPLQLGRWLGENDKGGKLR